MKERHHAAGHVLSDSVQRGDWRPKKRAHRLNVRIDEDLLQALRRESAESGASLSAVTRLALAAGIEAVRDRRVTAAAIDGLQDGGRGRRSRPRN